MYSPWSLTTLTTFVAVAVSGCSRAPDEKSQVNASNTFYTVDHYDENRDATADLAMTIDRAKRENKRILIQVGGDWCGWCHLMSNFIEGNDLVREKVDANYLLMKVTYTTEHPNEQFLSNYPEIKGYPHLYVLDADGKLLHSQPTAELEEGKGYNEQAYLAFLNDWKP
jgi:thioredoxin-related protein